MAKSFEWIETYEKTADKLLDFKNNRSELLQDIKKIYDQIALKYPFIDGEDPLRDVDPFSIFATFNRGITDKNRISIIHKMIEKWDIEAETPESFDGIPLANNMSAWFIAGKDRRGPGDVNQLWDLFEQAINYSKSPKDKDTKELFINNFNKVRKQKVVTWKITIGLFWVRPDTFINLDGKTRSYLDKYDLVDRKVLRNVPTGEEYLKLCEKVKTKMHEPPFSFETFTELSHQAYIETDEPIDPDTPPENDLEQDNQYFWINYSPQVRGISNYHELLGKTIEYSWGVKDKPTVRRISATSKIKQGDKVLLVDIEPDSGIFAKAEVASSPHPPNSEFYIEKFPDGYVIDLKVTEVFEKIPRTIISEFSSFENTTLQNLLKAVSVNELYENQYMDLVNYIKDQDNEVVEVKQKLDFNDSFRIKDLFFENKSQIERQVQTALVQGKNIIFTGPPGTGKSKLAKIVADFYQANYKMITASSNWSTYETLGGYHPNKQNELYFKPGLFLSCVKDSQTGDNINQWLIIDELNRADIDKAFGSFFSVVTGDAISLPFETDSGQHVQLIPETAETKRSKADHLYYYPSDWRLLATMNTADKSSLFELSYAFMRRFAFINIDVPRNIDEEAIDNYLSAWGVKSYTYTEELAKLWSILNKHRKMGPAIIEDIVKYTEISNDLTDAILLYVMPQLEGMSKEDLTAFVREVEDALGDKIEIQQIKEFSRDFFGELL